MGLPFWKVQDSRLSEAIVLHVGLMWDKEAEGKIVEMVGEEGLAKIKEMDAFANRAEVWTVMESMAAYRLVKKELGERYGFLSAEAVECLATRAAWGWR